jgi:hypothetical protein
MAAGRFSPEVAQPVRHLPRTQAPGYGPRTKVEAVYLQSHPLLPYERKVDALGDLFGSARRKARWPRPRHWPTRAWRQWNGPSG